MSPHRAIAPTYERLKTFFATLAHALDPDPEEERRRWVAAIEQRLRRLEEALPPGVGERRDKAPDN